MTRFPFRSRSRSCIGQTVWSCVLALTLHLNQPLFATPATLANQYPPGSIQTALQAQAALDAVQKEKQLAETEHASRQKDCYEKFLVTPCLDEERTRHQETSAVLNAISLEANRTQRQLKASQTEQRRHDAEAERLRQAPQQAVRRQQNLESNTLKQADGLKKQQEQQQKAEQAVAKPAKQARTVHNDPAQRQKNAADYQKKNQQAAEHRAQTAKRRAENMADQERKAAARAVLTPAPARTPIAEPTSQNP